MIRLSCLFVLSFFIVFTNNLFAEISPEDLVADKYACPPDYQLAIITAAQCPASCSAPDGNTCQFCNQCEDGCHVNSIEECDDGNSDHTDLCRADCKLPACGDGISNTHDFDHHGETCEPSLLADCREDCTFCGDGIVNGNEQCDGSIDCNDNCVVIGCDNGFLEPENDETCDPSDPNDPNADICRPASSNNPCTFCGDDILQDGIDEECDGDDIPIDAAPGSNCNSSCQLDPFCGDGIINQANELCDDGNNIDDDECSNTCNDSCVYYQVKGSYDTSESQKARDGHEQYVFHYKGQHEDVPCLEQFAFEIGNIKTISRWQDGDNIRNDDLAWWLLLTYVSGFTEELEVFKNSEYNRSTDITWPEYQIIQDIIGVPRFKADDAYLFDRYLEGRLYMDLNCEPVLEEDLNGDVCGLIEGYHIASPISLIWVQDQSLSDASVSQFPLDPSKPAGSWFSWKASSGLPLLVYDPEHTGVITSASQLFGNWTYKNLDNAPIKKIALIDENNNFVPWTHGYEPLAILDLDYDGYLRGAELEPLGLWFDHNKNGVSEPGEVKPLLETGVTSIKVTPDGQNEFGDYYASDGYTKTVDGKEITLGTVDWFADVFDSKNELVKLMDSALSSNTSKDRIDHNSINYGKNFVSGLWKWKVDDLPAHFKDQQFKPQGILALFESKKGVFGHSIKEVALRDNPDQIKSFITSFPIVGKRLNDKETISIEFDTSGEGMITKNIANFDPQNQTMTGSSDAIITSGLDNIQFQYNWSATRVVKRD